MMSSESETRDFMSVDSFSQLPFTRPAPAVKEKTNANANNSTAPIRLFGIEFPNDSDAAANPVDEEYSSSLSSTSKENNAPGFVLTPGEKAAANANSGGGSGESSRKFECHYCRRNFPTSQALGGHQNAHKRERQQAKRAHLQSALAAAAAHHHHGFLDGHFYGLANYHYRLGGATQYSSGRFGGNNSLGHTFDPLHAPPSTYPSSPSIWAGAAVGGFSTTGPRFYGGPASALTPPLDGSRFQGMWGDSSTLQGGGGGGLQLPTHRERPSYTVPFTGGDGSSRVVVAGMSTGVGGFGSMLSSSHSRTVFEPAATASVKENLSLDLHL